MAKKPKKKAVSLSLPRVYSVEYTPAALTQLGKVTDPLRTQLAKRLHKLKDNPHAQADKLEGFDFWKVRQGDFRAIFQIRDQTVLVLVVKIGNRKDVYRDLKNLPGA